MRRLPALLLLAPALLLPAAPARAKAPPAGFRPDPRSVQRYGPAYRYPQAGWIVLNIEGHREKRCPNDRMQSRWVQG